MSLDTRNAELEEKLEVNPIDEQIAALARSDASRKRQVRWLAVSLALDVLLTIGFGYATLRANNAASKAETTQHSIVRNCETTNESRAKNREIWDYIVQISERPNLTPEQQKTRDDFIMKLNDTFAPRDCSKVVQ